MSGAKIKQAGVSLVSVAMRAKEAASGSRWAGLAGRAIGYLAAFVLLTLVGSGRLSGWMSPPPRLAVGVPVAAAATLPQPPGTAPAASANTSAPPAAPPDAGAAARADPPAATEDADAGAASAGVASDGKVILNLATEDDLRRLPGIGATRARAILALRGRLKRFGRVEDLLKVKGIGRRSLARLRPLVRID